MFVQVLSTQALPFQKQSPLTFAVLMQLSDICRDPQLVTFGIHFNLSSETKQPVKNELQFVSLAIIFPGVPSTVATSHVFSTHFNVDVFHKQTGEIPC